MCLVMTQASHNKTPLSILINNTEISNILRLIHSLQQPNEDCWIDDFQKQSNSLHWTEHWLSTISTNTF